MAYHKNAKVALQLVTWNGKKYLPTLFDSIQNQTVQDIEVFILDNGSTDGSQELIKRFAELMKGRVHVTLKQKNTGFVGGHNELWKQTQGFDYVLLVNQDLVYEPNMIELLLDEMEADTTIAAISPRIMKWGKGKSFQKNNIVDSLGIYKTFYWEFREIDGGAMWKERKKSVLEVEGVSGTTPLYRRSAIESLPNRPYLFDPLFFSYKEDIDLCLSLKKCGMRVCTLLTAVCYHDRSAVREKNLMSHISKKMQEHDIIRTHSYKNHLILLIRYVRGKEILAIPAILCYELLKFAYTITLRPKVFFYAIRFLFSHRKELCNK